GVIPLCMAHIGDSVAYHERQAVLAKFLVATIFGMIAGQWLGGVFADVLDWRAAFALMAILFGAITIPLFRALPHRATSSGAQRQGFIAQTMGVVRSPWARLILVLALLEGALVFSALVFIPTFLYDKFQLPLSVAGAIVAAFGAGGLLYALRARPLIARMGERGLALYGGLLQAAGFATLVFSPHWAWSIPACFMAGMGFYMLHNTLQANATQMAPEARGTAVSLFACSLFLGQSLGISLVALLVDFMGVAAVFIVNILALP